MVTDPHDARQHPDDARPDLSDDNVWLYSRYTSALNASRFYRVMAVITGILLLILTVEMIYKYIIVGLILNGDVSQALMIGNFNLAAAIAISHGWCYVVYLISCLWLNQTMRWMLSRLLVMALAGVVPVMSFILERRVHHRVQDELDAAVVVAPVEG